MKIILYSFFTFIIFFINSCANTSACRDGFGRPIPHSDVVSALPIAKYIDNMADSLYPRFGGGSIMITDFVNTTTYQSSPAGILMAEILKASISNKTNAKIIQADFSKSFRLTPNGLVALTRDIEKVMPNNTHVPIALVGSYNIFNNSLYIFIKRINIRNASIIHSVSRKMSFSCFGDYIIDTTSNNNEPSRGFFSPR